MHCIFVINVIFTVLFCHVLANMEQLQKDFTEVIMECMKENPVTAAEIELMKTRVLPDSTTAKCLFACAYKNTGMMDAEGKFSSSGVIEHSKKYFANDPEKLKGTEEFNKFCLSVNDDPVSDGNKGCDRAALIFQCTLKFAPTFGYVSS